MKMEKHATISFLFLYMYFNRFDLYQLRNYRDQIALIVVMMAILALTNLLDFDYHHLFKSRNVSNCLPYKQTG